MLRDVCFHSHRSLPVNREVLQHGVQHIAVGDVDLDGLDEVVLCDRAGNIQIVKEFATLATYKMNLMHSVEIVFVRNIPSMCKTPLIVVASSFGTLTLLRLTSSSSNDPGDSHVIKQFGELSIDAVISKTLCCEMISISLDIPLIIVVSMSKAYIFCFNIKNLEDRFQLVQEFSLDGEPYSMTAACDVILFGMRNGIIQAYEIKASISSSKDNNGGDLDVKHVSCSKLNALPEAIPSFTAYSGPVVVEGFSRSNDAFSNIFGAAWLDGRLCICSISARAPGQSCPTWSVLKSFSTHYPLFSIQFSFCNFSNLEVFMSAGHRTIAYNSHILVMAAARSGHVVFVALSPERLLSQEESCDGSEQDKLPRVFCFDSDHMFKFASSRIGSNEFSKTHPWQGAGSLKEFCIGRTIRPTSNGVDDNVSEASLALVLLDTLGMASVVERVDLVLTSTGSPYAEHHVDRVLSSDANARISDDIMNTLNPAKELGRQEDDLIKRQSARIAFLSRLRCLPLEDLQKLHDAFEKPDENE